MDTDPNSAPETLISLDNVGLLLDENDKGKGKLVLTSATVTWTGSAEELVWAYRTILMHAVSKEGSNPAIYAQLQGNDEYELLEARFVPEDATKLDDLFAAFSRGACLNPDEPGDDEGAGDFYFDDQEVRMGLDNGDFEEDDEEEGQDSEMANGTN